jgi:hypothetical protein
LYELKMLIALRLGRGGINEAAAPDATSAAVMEMAASALCTPLQKGAMRFGARGIFHPLFQTRTVV